MGVFLRVLLIVAGVLLVMKLLKGRSTPPPAAPVARPPRPPAEIVACAHCGLRLPQAEAVQAGDGRFFCGEAHRRVAGQRLD
ncbi:PP0621 family protein [Aquariibacter albus]|uniref:PP0621 family protein n=1 Tax=Aquariibacter albus TaxID=2759899 RepID=UPI001F375933|nr:PP0621 family protein [Aquariibacter albus]